jgi:hypothetical protein
MRLGLRAPATRLALSLTILAVIIVALGIFAKIAPAPVWRLVALVVVSHLPYAAALVLAWKHPCAISIRTTIGIALGLRLILVFVPPVFSDDLYRYIWDGRVLQSGTNPYEYAPSDVALAELRNDNWRKINNPDLRTIYPPLGQLYFVLVTAVTPHELGFKIAAALMDSVVVLLVFLLGGGGALRKTQTDSPEHRSALVAALAYGLNPLAAVESGMSGHLDSFALVPTLGALLVLEKRHHLKAALLTGIGAGIKLAPAFLFPVIARRRRIVWLLFPLFLLLLYLPFVSAGQGTVETLDTFIRRWEGNAGLFAAVKTGVWTFLEKGYGVTGADAMIHLRWLDPLADALQGTFFALHKDGGFDPARPGAFSLLDLSLAFTKGLLGLIFAIVLAFVTLRRFEPVRATLWIMGTLVLVTPVLHPWYVLWVLPFAALRRAWSWFVLGSTAALAYLPLDGWWRDQIWKAPALVPWVEYGTFAAAGIIYFAVQCKRTSKK